MDRRTFNKALSGLFAGALIPISTPLVTSMVGGATPGHFGLSHVGLTTYFDLSPIFGLGQLAVYPDLDEEPKIEGEFAYYTNKEKTIEKSVFFESTHKEYRTITKPIEKHPTPCLDVNMIADGTARVFYEMKDLEVFLTNGGDQIDLMDVERGKRYDIVLSIDSGQDDCIVTMKNSLINDIITWNTNEDNFQS